MPTQPSGLQITLAAYGQELVVVEVGGGIRSYEVAGRAVIQGYGKDEMCSAGRGQILAPWPNRLDAGTFEWEGQERHTPLSEADRGNAIHGLVRWSAWAVRTAQADRVVLVHRLHPQPGWPWRLDFLVEYLLTPEGLVVRTAVTNDAGTDVPFGLGWHPYLTAFGGRVDDVTLTLPGVTRYESDDRGLPTGTFDVSGTDSDFRSGRRIGAAVLDDCYSGLQRGAEGRAVVTAAGGEGITRLWVDEAYTHLMVFSGDTLSPGDRRSALAVEPMTCAPNALRSGDGLRVLTPGETFEATWGLQAG